MAYGYASPFFFMHAPALSTTLTEQRHHGNEIGTDCIFDAAVLDLCNQRLRLQRMPMKLEQGNATVSKTKRCAVTCVCGTLLCFNRKWLHAGRFIRSYPQCSLSVSGNNETNGQQSQSFGVYPRWDECIAERSRSHLSSALGSIRAVSLAPPTAAPTPLITPKKQPFSCGAGFSLERCRPGGVLEAFFHFFLPRSKTSFVLLNPRFLSETHERACALISIVVFSLN